MLNKYAIDPKNVGRIDVAIETTLEEAKFLRKEMAAFFARAGNLHVEGIDSHRSTGALFNTVNWVESTSWDGRPAIAVEGGFQISPSGRGIAAILVGPNAPLVLEREEPYYLFIDILR